MNKFFYSISFSLIALLATTACGTPPVKATPEMKGKTFSAPSDKVFSAVIKAFEVVECTVNTNNGTNYADCKRPNKVGLFVGSGGETISAYVEGKSAKETEVKVNTAKSFVGYAGQRNWDEDVLAEIEKALAALPKK